MGDSIVSMLRSMLIACIKESNKVYRDGILFVRSDKAEI
jgi:hypothetical protein